jgi:hypothetical protein
MSPAHMLNGSNQMRLRTDLDVAAHDAGQQEHDRRVLLALGRYATAADVDAGRAGQQLRRAIVALQRRQQRARAVVALRSS